MLITSRQNEIIKRVKSLHLTKYRRSLSMHFIEGEKLLNEAYSSGMIIEALFHEEGISVKTPANEIYAVTRPVMEALCDTQHPQGVCAAVQNPTLNMPAAFPTGMLVALDDLQDPGNLGMIIRTADAMGASGILLSEGCADPLSPKCVRAAMGSTYHVPLYSGNLFEALYKLRNDGYCLICGHLQGKELLPHPTDRCVIVIGNEGNGVHESIAALCAKVRLPIYGKAESLNASMAAGLLMYEAAKMMHTYC